MSELNKFKFMAVLSWCVGLVGFILIRTSGYATTDTISPIDGLRELSLFGIYGYIFLYLLLVLGGLFLILSNNLKKEVK